MPGPGPGRSIRSSSAVPAPDQYRHPAAQGASMRSATGAAVAALLLGEVADGLDVVAVRVTDECAVVAGVVFRPQPRLVQDRRAVLCGGAEKGPHRRPVGCREGNV